MIPVEEALEKILNNINILEPETKPILECLGQVLAGDVYSEVTIPPLDNSAMDGYAVQWESIRGASEANPVELEIIGEVAAGYIFEGEVTLGTAVRIMTGAPVPAGADTIVQFEHTDEETRKSAGYPTNKIGILRETAKGKNVRMAGEDVAKGNLILTKGTVLRPQEIGVLASLGLVETEKIYVGNNCDPADSVGFGAHHFFHAGRRNSRSAGRRTRFDCLPSASGSKCYLIKITLRSNLYIE